MQKDFITATPDSGGGWRYNGKRCKKILLQLLQIRGGWRYNGKR
jgi:hypothetical protein